MQKLPESELEIMLALWESNNPEMPRSYFDEKLAHRKWTVSAMNSFLSRLEEKGFIKSVRKGRSNYYSALIKRDDYREFEGKNILGKLYDNSIKNFLLSISDKKGLEQSDINDLQEYLDTLKKE